MWATGARNFQLRSRERWRTTRGSKLGRWVSNTQPDALDPTPNRPRAHGDAGPGELRNPKQRCAGELLRDGTHRATTHDWNKVKRKGAPLCTLVATYLSDLGLGFVAIGVAPLTVIRHVIFSTEKVRAPQASVYGIH